MSLTARERIALEIVNCGEHRDVCCAADKRVFDKLAYWMQIFGRDGAYELILLACTCQSKVVNPPTPPGPPAPPPPLPPAPPPATPPLACSELPPKRVVPAPY